MPISESTKNKLKAFQFEPPKPVPDQNTPAPVKSGKEKENDAAPGLLTATPRGSGVVDHAVTPVNRPAWQDLLGAQEPVKEEDVASPSQRIMWRIDPKNDSSISITPMLSRKGRKRRARSSSPVSSPAASKTPALAPKTQQHLGLETPHADPTSGFWGAAPGAMNPLLLRTMTSSSPRPPKIDGVPESDRALRKANSCGSNWPKRRRIERLDADQSAASQGTGKSTSRSSLVSALLETVDGEIKRSKSTEAQEEQSSSPSRRRSPRKAVANAPPQVVRPSPIRELAESRDGEFGSSSSNTMDQLPIIAENDTSHQPSSDYGDDDFDEDTLMELDVIANPLAQEGETTLVAVDMPSPAATTHHAPKAVVEEEFEGVDDDLFDEAEDLVTGIELKYFSQAAQGDRHDRPAQSRGVVDEFYDVDDDFGNDLDLEAMELAATQSATRALALNNVRSLA